jgi:hypothetical protein
MRFDEDRITVGVFKPVPVRGTLWGLPGALSATDMDPFRAPAAVGLNVTEMVQLALAATVRPQVLLWLKSPIAVMLLIVSATPPVLVNVTVWATHPVHGAPTT